MVFEFYWNKKRVRSELLVMIMSKLRQPFLLLTVLLLCTALFAVPAMAATTQLHIVKYANDGTTILNETTKTYQWLEANLQVFGDGTTHYYHQGPVFIDNTDPVIEQALRWNPAEDTNVQEKDNGAVKGTNLKDICDLVGGMKSGETLKLRASDGLIKTFAYTNVYEYPARQGPMVITWYQNGNYPDTTYADGMKLVFFADNSTNPWGIHAMGNYDWHESAAPQDRYYNTGDGGEQYPTTTGLSVKYISDVLIYSNQAPPVILFDGNVTLVSGETFNKTAYNSGTSYSISKTTPLGALQTAATTAGFGYDVTDKRWTNDQVLLLDNISTYTKATGKWYAYVNGVYRDGYGNHTNGLNVIELANNDQVNFYFAPNSNPDPIANASAVVKIKANVQAPGPVVNTLFDGVVTLVQGETFTKQAYNNVTGGLYTINRTTPLGALDKVATLQSLTYDVTDKRWTNDQVLLLDNISTYTKATGKWYAYINGVYRDGYGNHTNGLNVIELANNDQVNFYFAPNSNPDPIANASAVVKIKANVQAPGPVVDTLFEGTVNLAPDTKFTLVPYNNLSASYQVNTTTPLGALDSVNKSAGIRVDITDKNYGTKNILMVDNIGKYLYNKNGSITYSWICQVNGVTLDDFGAPATDGLNIKSLANGDQVNFYYGMKPVTPGNATAAVKIKVNIGGQPPVTDWTFSLNGATNTSVTKTFFEQGLACPASGHQVFWTDADNNTWGGVPLWVLVAMVDDNPDVGPDHFNFNDSIAAQGYSVKIISDDGWDTTLSSQNIARNNSILVVNTLNGTPLPFLTPAGKRSWPLHLKGPAVFGGQQVGNITKIELTGLPQPPTEWKLVLEGDVTDVITQSYFVDAIACHHNVTWTDTSGNVWQGVSLWDLVGAVDDIESSNHFTFNDTRAAANYTIRVSAADFSADFYSIPAAHNDGFFVAYKKNGAPLTGSDAPIKLVGPATTKGSQRVGNITKISLIGLPDQYPAGNWQLKMVGKVSDVIPQGEFEYSADCHNATYTDINGNVYTGIPLWRLMGWVDDRIPHGSDGFNDPAAIAGYKVIVKAGDGYAKEFTSQQIGKTNAFIVANTYNGGPIPNDGSHPPYPLRLVGTGATGGNSVGNLVEIQLTDFQTPTEAPKLHIIKYAGDGATVINETFVDYIYMENNLPVIGDGTTAYKFEGLTMNPSNLWDPEETYPGGFKISNVVKGTRVHDLAELVGGMGSGTTITFVANDGFETTLPYSSIYTNPAVQARQGDAIIAWWGDGQYVPNYADGMRLFFTPDGDHVYGHWDMHETLPSQYWRYNFQDGVQYPSSAGLSAKYITTIKVYSTPESDWTLELDGREIGGVNYTVAKPFLEEALGCQFGADHKATYTDSKGRVWEGMPSMVLYRICR